MMDLWGGLMLAALGVAAVAGAIALLIRFKI